MSHTVMLRHLLCSIFLLLSFSAAADFNRAAQNFAAERYSEAITEFTQLAQLGHNGAQFNLGAMYFLGQGVEKNPLEAYAWIALASEADNADSNSVALRKRLWSRFNNETRRQARERFEELKSLYGQQALQENLWPVIHENDKAQIIKIAHKQSPQFPQRALNLRLQGSVDVEFSLDRDGQVTDYYVVASSDTLFNNATLAAFKHWRFEPWIIDDEPVPVAGLGLRMHFRTGEKADIEIGTQLHEETMEALRRRAEAGEAIDMFNYAYASSLVYDAGEPLAGITRWYLKSAMGGSVQAQYQLGRHLTYGFGCERDTEKAERWLTLAAESGLPAAQYFLAQELQARDPELAAQWLERAVAARHPEAMVKLAWLLATDPDEARRDGERALVLINSQLNDYPDQLTARRTLAASHAAAGDFAAAVTTQEDVIKLTQALQRPPELETERLEAYRQQAAWRE